MPVVTLAEAKAGARIDDDRFDADIPRWVDTAIDMAEQYCDVYFTPKRPNFERTDWPLTGDTFPISGATSATASYWNGLSLIHISEPTRRHHVSRMPSSA